MGVLHPEEVLQEEEKEVVEVIEEEALSDEFENIDDNKPEKPAGIFTHSHAMEKMAGISWNRMPSMPDKHEWIKPINEVDGSIGKTPQEELILATEELKEATMEWQSLFDPKTIEDALSG